MCSAICYNPHQARLRPFSIQVFTYCCFLLSCSFYWNIRPAVMEKTHRNLSFEARIPGFHIISISFLTSRTNHFSLPRCCPREVFLRFIRYPAEWEEPPAAHCHQQPEKLQRSCSEAAEKLQRSSFSGLLLLLKTLLSPIMISSSFLINSWRTQGRSRTHHNPFIIQVKLRLQVYYT